MLDGSEFSSVRVLEPVSPNRDTVVSLFVLFRFVFKEEMHVEEVVP